MKIPAILLGILFALPILAQQPAVLIAENTLKIPAFGEETFYYGFAEGDQLIFSFEEQKGKELKEVEIIELPGASRFMDHKTKKIEQKIIQVHQTGVYKFRFTNSALVGRICKFKVERVPASELSKSFNPTVFWKTIYDSIQRKEIERFLVKKEYRTVSLLTPEEYFINGGRVATFANGTSRVCLFQSHCPRVRLNGIIPLQQHATKMKWHKPKME